MNNHQKSITPNRLFWVIPVVFIIGLWLVVIQPLGPRLSQLPGDLGDARFNSYILEHNYRWISGNLRAISQMLPKIQSYLMADNLKFPGFNSIRAVSRIILVLMWPVAMIIAVMFDSLIDKAKGKPVLIPIVVFLFGLMMAESIFYEHATFPITESNNRLSALREQIPNELPPDAVLYFWHPEQQPWYLLEIDAMLLSQDLDRPVMNGYSGFFPAGYGESRSCDEAVTRISKYMSFENIDDPAFFEELQSRIVAVGPTECQWSDPPPEN